MKKKKFFSRIFAAALAVAISATTLITNSGAGLLASALEGETGNEGGDNTTPTPTTETYSVKIISPDVPADGKTYSYNFYQIIAGEVEEDKSKSEEDKAKNLLANPKWGAALGGENFDKVPTGKTPVGGMAYDDAAAGIGYYPSSEVLLGTLSGTMSCQSYATDTTPQPCQLLLSMYNEYKKILNSYGESSTTYADNYFFKKFKYGLNNAGTYTGFQSGNITRDVKGLVELLNAGSTSGALKTTDLKAFADLLLNGVTVEIDLGTTHEEEKDGVTKTVKDIESYTYNFITGDPQATQNVKSDDKKTEYTVENLAPGYYLVACVGADNKLSNNGYETSMPVKPVSTMLILVGPANDGVAEIVGKNAYTVPTITLDMYQKPVKLSTVFKTGTNNWTANSHGGYVNEVEAIDTIIRESADNWKNTGSFDYYKHDDTNTDRKDAILYRIGITLPLNFDQYKDSGYFLAVLDQYCHYNASSNNKEIERVSNVRPYIYVKSGSKYTFVGRYMGNQNDTDSGTDSVIGKYVSSIQNTLTADGNNVTYNKNTDLGFNAHDLFCLGDLYTHTTNTAENGTTTTTHTTVYKPGDTIYIYYPAILNDDNTGVYSNNAHYLLNVNRIWAVYSNNPYAKTLTAANSNGNGYSHVVNGDVGITPISEANVNTYSVTLKVEGEDSKYADGAIFALYREVGENKTKEYACAAIGNTVYVKKWMPESELEAGDTIEDRLFKTYEKKKGTPPFLANSISTGVPAAGIEIRGLAAGEYYLLELTISCDSTNKKNPSHDNLKKHHYKLAEEPIKFNVGNEYNKSVNGYLGTRIDSKEENGETINKVVSDATATGNSKTFISQLTVDFLQDNPERAIDTYIDKPLEAEFDDTEPKVKYTKDEDGRVVTNLATKTYGEGDDKVVLQTYATEDGQIEIRVNHKTINLIWLPETGGIGTMIFFIVGGTIVVAAVVMIVTRFRVKRERL